MNFNASRADDRDCSDGESCCKISHLDQWDFRKLDPRIKKSTDGLNAHFSVAEAALVAAYVWTSPSNLRFRSA